MAPGAELHLATNLEWYAREAAAAIPRDFAFDLMAATEVAATARPRTHFEKKYLARGETCFDLVFRRR